MQCTHTYTQTGMHTRAHMHTCEFVHTCAHNTHTQCLPVRRGSVLCKDLENGLLLSLEVHRIGIKDPLTGWDGQNPLSPQSLIAPALCPTPCWGLCRSPWSSPQLPVPAQLQHCPAQQCCWGQGLRLSSTLCPAPVLGSTGKTCLSLSHHPFRCLYALVETSINVVVYLYTMSWSSQRAACLLCYSTV